MIGQGGQMLNCWLVLFKIIPEVSVTYVNSRNLIKKKSVPPGLFVHFFWKNWYKIYCKYLLPERKLHFGPGRWNIRVEKRRRVRTDLHTKQNDNLRRQLMKFSSKDNNNKLGFRDDQRPYLLKIWIPTLRPISITDYKNELIAQFTW